MKRTWTLTLAVIGIASIAMTAVESNAAVYVDFGDTTTSTIGSVTWNNVTNTTTNGTINDLLTDANGSSGIKLVVGGGWNGISNSGGKTDVGLSSDAGTAFGTSGTSTVQTDYIFTPTTGTMTFSQLDPTKTYTITTYGNRNSSGNRNALYTATGLNTVSGSHENTFNVTNVTKLENVVPNASNSIVLTTALGSGNTAGFAYVNAIRIDVNSAAVPEPTTLGLLGGAASLLAVRRRRSV